MKKDFRLLWISFLILFGGCAVFTGLFAYAFTNPPKENPRQWIRAFSEELIDGMQETYQVDVSNATLLYGYIERVNWISSDKSIILLFAIREEEKDTIFSVNWTESISWNPPIVQGDIQSFQYIGEKRNNPGGWTEGIAYYTAPDVNNMINIYFKGANPPW